MADDTLNERHGYVKKGSGFGGSIALIGGIGLLVAAAGVAGLQYGMSHGWDQPGSSSQAPLDPPTTSINPEHLEGTSAQPSDKVETTSATMPIIVNEPAAGATPAADAPAAKPTQPYIPPSHAHHKSTDNAAPAAADPFGTTQ